MKNPAFPFLMILLLISCKTTHYANPDDYTGRQLIISEGGGISGKVTQTIILENGQVFIKTIFPSSLKESDPVSRRTTREIFDRLDNLNIEEISFIHPGNMTYSIATRNGSEIHEVKWGDPAFEVPSKVLEYYQYVRKQIISE